MNILIKLKEKAAELGSANLFNPGASAVEIASFEKEMGLELPALLKAFYMQNNGGCFAVDWSEEDLEDPEMKADIAWNANYFLTLEEIIDTYNMQGPLRSFEYPSLEQKTGRRLIPIIHSDQQEMIVLDLTDPEKTLILDAFHEYSLEQWGELYQSFEALLEEYISNDGMLDAEA